MTKSQKGYLGRGYYTWPMYSSATALFVSPSISLRETLTTSFVSSRRLYCGRDRKQVSRYDGKVAGRGSTKARFLAAVDDKQNQASDGYEETTLEQEDGALDIATGNAEVVEADFRLSSVLTFLGGFFTYQGDGW
jgi:hypothetical protein